MFVSQEHVIEEWKDCTALLHNELIHQYREVVTAAVPVCDPTTLEEVSICENCVLVALLTCRFSDHPCLVHDQSVHYAETH